MKSLSAFAALLFLANATAATSDIEAVDTIQTFAECNVGQKYCFDQVVDDLKYPRQDFINKFCADNNYITPNGDCATCNTDKGCLCGQDCRTSTWLCTGPRDYEFQEMCHVWCTVGECTGSSLMPRRQEMLRASWNEHIA
ncbi:hypothetical protein BDV96DRAFT_639746 [Lophiotrema nucula]|uniref:Protein priA n=1 Tax=Lophiotrema nucula TaxID=690887 RepID=A0A6A5ZVX9_9PLEO|nr:hypothetical protein BDV96DRAFT_639746 [Lophiotrema nucula]